MSELETRIGAFKREVADITSATENDSPSASSDTWVWPALHLLMA
jgi:hypothetical protein